MHINDLPFEILSEILSLAAELNEKDGVAYTLGLSQAPMPYQPAKLQRYIRGPICPEIQKWDCCSPMRQTCSLWHQWALDATMKDVYVRIWRGSERWFELPRRRHEYELYQFVPSGCSNEFGYIDPFLSLKKTTGLLRDSPSVARVVRRVWFNGFYTADITPSLLFAVKCCPNLRHATLPWTALRHCSAEAWADALRQRDDGRGVETLEFLSVDLKQEQVEDPINHQDLQPFRSPLINLSGLRKLKFFGDTKFMPISDNDLKAIARTATQLEELHITCMSTISIDGVMALVKASQNTLRVLEHAPRSGDGFFHPHPGSVDDGEHLCEVLTSARRLQSVSISLPSVCESLFANEAVKWHSDFQVRAASLCPCVDEKSGKRLPASVKLRRLLDAARQLQASRPLWGLPPLPIEIFFADCIFEPHSHSVHGDFTIAEFHSSGIWPPAYDRILSRKGPYGSTGLYGKDEVGVFEEVSEEDYLRALDRKWVSVPE